jgi:mycothiol synthase
MSRIGDAETDAGGVLGIPGARLRMATGLSAEQVADVTALCVAATEADGVQPLSEHVTLHLRLGGEGPDRHLLVLAADQEDKPDHGHGPETVIGYAHLDPTDAVSGTAAELVVNPRLRGHGVGRLLVETALAATPDGRLRLWAHGDHPAARALAAALGFAEGRRLEQWRRSLFSPLPPLELTDGVVLRTFRPGTDDEPWLTLNARAFADHPEQGSWTMADLHARMDEAWFDPEGFLIAEEDGVMVGFHWTKVHGSTMHVTPGEEPHAHEPIGEVYVVGVDPDHQGRGLGRSLTLAGLHRLRAQGLPQAMLYVEGDNAAAQTVYRRLGFAHWDTDVMFYRRPDAG